jgi:hypothetical protein
MAGSRTLKLSILAETKDLVAGLNTASKETQSFGDKASEFGKKAALAFAVAGTAALAFAADAVKAAAQDALAQEKLAETIKATTNATAAQIAGVEEYITATSIAIGVTDDELRPAFSRLVRSVSDVDQAQRLLNLALDLSAAVGKPVETVANALAKAYDGNTTALAKLGLGLDANLLKSKDNEAIIKSLETTYGDFAEGAAETAAKKFERIKIATDEAKESIGAALLPVVERLADYVLMTVVPNLQSFINGLTGEGSLEEASENATDGAFKFGEQVKKVIKTVISLKDELLIVGGVIAGLFVVSKIAAAVTGTIALIRTIITAYNALKASSIVAGVAAYFALNPLAGVAAVGIAAAVLAGATALANRSNVDLDNLGGGGGGSAGFSGTMPNGQSFTTGDRGGSSSRYQTAADLPAYLKADAQGNILSEATGEIVGRLGKITTAAEKVVTNVAGAFDNFTSGTTTLAGINAASTNAFPFGTSGVNTNTLAGINAASVINVTVNGAIDKEGTARTIVDTLNNSYYRGTGGATNLQSA